MCRLAPQRAPHQCSNGIATAQAQHSIQLIISFLLCHSPKRTGMILVGAVTRVVFVLFSLHKEGNDRGIARINSSSDTMAVSASEQSIEAILFDMDGTLLDTEALSDKALLLAFGDALPKDILARAPMSNFRIPWELKKQLLGLRGTEWAPIMLEYAKKHWGVQSATNSDLPAPPEVPEFIAAWEHHLNNMCEEIDACKGAVELVAALAKTGIPMAIATSSRHSGVMKKRKRHETTIFQHMQVIVTGDDPAVKNGKPAPDIYLEAAKRLNVDPSKCLVLEDALSGVRSGKSAGCAVLAVPDTRFTADELRVFEDTADVVVEDLTRFEGTQFGWLLNGKP